MLSYGFTPAIPSICGVSSSVCPQAHSTLTRSPEVFETGFVEGSHLGTPPRIQVDVAARMRAMWD
jgi:hypothetical protein